MEVEIEGSESTEIDKSDEEALGEFNLDCVPLTALSKEELSKKVLSKIEPGGSLFSELVGSLIASKINTENLSECIHEMEAQELIKLTHNYRVSSGPAKDAIRGCSFQILVQKMITNEDGTKTVDDEKRVNKKFRRRIEKKSGRRSK